LPVTRVRKSAKFLEASLPPRVTRGGRRAAGGRRNPVRYNQVREIDREQAAAEVRRSFPRKLLKIRSKTVKALRFCYLGVGRMSEQPDKRELICELGRLVGQKHAFSLVAGACMAADAECLRRIREEKAYRALHVTWDQFCRERVGITRPVGTR
jgi:hypothetical protein